MHDPALQGHSGRGRSSGRGKCNCCPYGYHLDLDFVRYCEKVSASGLLQSHHRSTIPRQNRRKRESTRESLLGLSQQVTSETTRKTPEHIIQRNFSEDLEKAVLDFEKIFNSSTRPRQTDVSQKQTGRIMNLDVKYNTIGGERVRDTCDEFKLNGTNNEIRHQVAVSLNRMKHLEEEVKIIPNLQNQLKKVRWENRRLIKLLEAAEKKMESNEKNLKDRSLGDLRESAIQTRTVGTGCCVLRRDIGTSYLIALTSTGTDPPPQPEPLQLCHKETQHTNLSAEKWTNTDLSCPHHSHNLILEKDRIRNPITVNAGVQTTSKKSFTIDFGIQTDKRLLQAPTFDVSIQHSSITPKPLTYTVGCQHEDPLMRISHSNVGLQFDTQIKKVLTHNKGVQYDITRGKKSSLKESGVQTDEKPTMKDTGVQNKPDLSNIGIIAKPLVQDNGVQTLNILKKDVGFLVNTLPQSLPKKSIGTNTNEEKTSPRLTSRLTDTTDLLRTSSMGVNTIKVNLVNTATDTEGGDEDFKKTESTSKKNYDLKSKIPVKGITKFYPSITSSGSAINSYSTVQQVRSNEKDLVNEELKEKVSPHASGIVPKPYEKKEPSKEMKGAMKVLNDNLLKSPSGEFPKTMRNAVNIVQQEWFKISSVADANPLDVEDYLDCFEELSVGLLEYIVNMTDVSGNTAMHYAVSNGNFDVVSILLDSKVCNINKLNTAGYTCIMLVALTKVKSDTDRQVVRRLFQMADVNIRARQHGQTALMLAVSHGRIDTVELLLESGADINIQDEDGSTALMCAAEHGYIDIVKLLLAQPDCDLSITDLDGNTALNIAMEAGNRDIGVLLYAQEHFSRGTSPFSSLKVRRAKSATPTLKTRTPTPPNCSQEHSL